MKDLKTDTSALEQMDVKELMVNTRINVEKARQEAKSSLARSKENSREINDLIIAMDRIQSRLESRIFDLESMLGKTLDLVGHFSKSQRPWYVRLWNKATCSKN